MCDRLNGLTDVGKDGFWDSTGTVSSGQINGVEYVFHEEPDPDLIADENKVCILDVVKDSPILGDGCYNCAKLIFLRKRSSFTQIPLTDTPE